MSTIGKRVHLVPTSVQYERLRRALEDYAADKVYILYNDDPVEGHQEVSEKLVKEVKSIVKGSTRCYSNDQVEEVGIDFYHFRDALISIYRILYDENENGNDVIVNLSGGTRPVAIASTFACSLTGVGQPIYYVADEYQVDGQQVESRGVKESPFPVTPLHSGPLNLQDKIPKDREKRDILLALLNEGEKSMKEMLVDIDKIAKNLRNSRDNRQKIIQRHHRHGEKLIDINILQKEGGTYALTDTGELIAELINVQESLQSR